LSFPPISELLPHRGQAIWLDRVVSCVGAECISLGKLPAWVDGQALAVTYGIELIAQAAAVHACLGAQDPKPGYVASVRRATFEVAHLPVNVLLEVKVTATGSLGRGRSFLGEIAHQGARLVSCELLIVESHPWSISGGLS
jgi:predicted hotdog family 3-hydroxylacyl-ACP dehydratase